MVLARGSEVRTKVQGLSRLPWMCAVSALFLMSCGAVKGSEGDTAAADVDPTSDTQIADAKDVGGGADGQDIASNADSDASPTEDAGSDVSSVCPGGPDCPCAKNDECDSNNCIETPDGQRCAILCGGGACPGNYTCTLINLGGGDVQYLCIPKWGRICEPCDNSTLCSTALGNDKGLCVAYGGVEGSFCGSSCALDTDCPSGYGCKDATSVEGKVAKQCVRNPDGGGHVQCPCDAAAKAQKLATVCSAAVVTGGYCPGVRTCSDKGLSDCTATPSAQETCDGVDNDCNGLIDDVICDDKNACTEDLCTPSTAKCSNTPNLAVCSDANACTTGDVCESGVCVGKSIDCDDQNACTADSCDKKLGCQYSSAAVPCDDGDKCTVADSCLDGECIPGKKTECSDKNPCTSDSCDLATGACTNTVLWGNACNDGDACTTGDACGQTGSCTGDPTNCDDNNVCTSDTCTPADGCDHLPVSTTCEDGNPCTVGDVCKNGVCAVGTLKDCGDQKSCTADSCDQKTGACVNKELDGGPCNDGSQCTDPDACQGDVCAGKAVPCDDSNSCTSDSCDPAIGCVYKQLAGACTDGNACTLGDTCNATFCLAGTPKSCDDNNPCTTDSCDQVSGDCKHTAKTGAPCEDGNACTGPDACGGGGAADGTVCAGAIKTCDDGNPCTDDACDTTTGCSNQDNSKTCDDNNACTQGDTCFLTFCKGGQINVAIACDDGNPCTADTCDKTTGCKHTATANLNCTDNNVCTVGDTCNADGQCIAGGNVCGCTTDDDCTPKDDGDPCNGVLYCNLAQAPYLCEIKPGSVITCSTSQDGECKKTQCDPAEAKCVTNNLTDGKLCNADGSVCTPTDTCQGGSCVADLTKDCDDKKPCTDDSCSPTVGCLNVANAGTCEDGNPCTEGDTCNSTYCIAGSAKVCDDDNGCTADKCDTVTGLCVFNDTLLNNTFCNADGTECTPGDSCQGGVCKAGPLTDCTDTNPCTDDSCEPFNGQCKHPYNTAGCDDNDKCTTGDICGSGACAGVKTNCADGTLCTTDSCDPATGGCINNGVPHEGVDCKNDNGGTGDANACTLGDVCTAGVCKGVSTVSCDDGEQCTTDSCDKINGCQHPQLAEGAPCSDGDPCSTGDRCTVVGQAFTCKFLTQTNCDDGNPCNTDACDAQGTGCVHTPLDDTTQILQQCDVTKWCVAGACKTKGCGDGYVDSNSGETCEDGNALGCDGCESCQARSGITLSGGAGYGQAGGSGVGTALAIEGDLTIEAWVKPTSVAATLPIVFHTNVASSLAQTYGLSIASGGKLSFQHNAGSLESVSSTSNVTAGVWSHVAVVVAGQETHGPNGSNVTVASGTGAEVRFFVNGTPAGKANLVQKRLATSGSLLVVGRRYLDDSGVGWTGGLDEVHVAAGALYGGKFTPPRRITATSATRGLWHLDDGAGTTAADASGSAQKAAYPLTLTGATWAADACYGAASNAGVCGDGVTAAAFEECDEGATAAGTNSCDACQECRVRKQLTVGGATTLATPVFSSFAPDAFCPNCEATIEFWAKRGANDTQEQSFLLASTCPLGSADFYCNGIAMWINNIPPDQPGGAWPVGTLVLARLGATGVATGGYGGTGIPTTKTLNAGEWHHIAVQLAWNTYGPARVYVDGLLVLDVKPSVWDSNAAVSVGNSFPGEALMFGGWPADSGGMPIISLVEAGLTPAQLSSIANFNGTIDDIRISTGLRYGPNFVPPRRHTPDGQTRALWHMDDANSAVADDSGRGTTPVLVGWSGGNDDCYGASGKNICNDGGLAPWEWADTLGNTVLKASSLIFPANAVPSATCGFSWSADTCTSIKWQSTDAALPVTANGISYPILSLNGGGSYGGPWTVEGWVKLPALPASGTGTIVSIDSQATGGGCSLPSAQAWAVQTTSDGTDASVLGTSVYSSTARKVWKAGVWQHFALSYHGDATGSLWVDGAKARDFTLSSTTWSANCKLRIGHREGVNSTNKVSGQMAALHVISGVKYGQPFEPATRLSAEFNKTIVFWDFTSSADKLAAGIGGDGTTNGGTLDIGSTANWLQSGPGCGTQVP